MERKRISWVGTSANDVAAFPVEAKLKLGTALRLAQEGDLHSTARAMKGPFREVTEIVAPCEDGTYRLMYTTQIAEVIYVLHTFKKKAHHGIATPKRDLALVERRLRLVKKLARK
jgi:phage-related protein